MKNHLFIHFNKSCAIREYGKYISVSSHLLSCRDFLLVSFLVKILWVKFSVLTRRPIIMIFLKIPVFEMSFKISPYILCVLGYMYDEERVGRGSVSWQGWRWEDNFAKPLVWLQLNMGVAAQPRAKLAHLVLYPEKQLAGPHTVSVMTNQCM